MVGCPPVRQDADERMVEIVRVVDVHQRTLQGADVVAPPQHLDLPLDALGVRPVIIVPLRHHKRSGGHLQGPVAESPNPQVGTAVNVAVADLAGQIERAHDVLDRLRAVVENDQLERIVRLLLVAPECPPDELGPARRDEKATHLRRGEDADMGRDRSKEISAWNNGPYGSGSLRCRAACGRNRASRPAASAGAP